MAVTTSPSYHGSPIHDGFATIRSARSRVKIRNVNGTPAVPLSHRHSEYFTLRRPIKNSFLDNNNDVEYVETPPVPPQRGIKLSFAEPIYAKVTPPPTVDISPVKPTNGHHEVHYDSINIRPRRRLKSLDLPDDGEVTVDQKNGIVKYANGDRLSYERSANADGCAAAGVEQHSNRSDFARFIADIKRSQSDRDNCSESSSYLTDNDRPVSSYSDNSTLPSTDNEDVLRELPSKSKFHRSPQKYATLNHRRPKSIELRSPTVPENPFYGSLHRGRMGYHSEPNTPMTEDNISLVDGCNPLTEVHQIPRMPLQNRSGFKRSVSENNGFNKRLNYRHSFSADNRIPVIKRPHKCCECITGIPVDSQDFLSPQISTRTLGTLYESQDPKIGCQTILRSKPPVPWWDLAMKKSRYKSCPILDEAHVVSAFEQSLSNMTQRLQQLTATAERKDSEVTELRQTIELLRKQSIQAGLTTAHMQSMGIRTDGVNMSGHQQDAALPPPPPTTQSSPQRKPPANGNGITRHLSTDSVSSLNSLSSGSSAQLDKKHKKKGWP